MRELTLVDLMEHLKQLEETYLVELLNITSEELIERFSDRIESDFDRLISEVEEYDGDGPSEG